MWKIGLSPEFYKETGEEVFGGYIFNDQRTLHIGDYSEALWIARRLNFLERQFEHTNIEAVDEQDVIFAVLEGE